MSCSFAKFEAATSSTLISIELYTLRQPDSYQRANEMLRSCCVFSEHELAPNPKKKVLLYTCAAEHLHVCTACTAC